MNKKLTALLAEGYTLECGAHHPALLGFYASLEPPTGWEEGQCVYDYDEEACVTWGMSGHGITPKDAIKNAVDITLGLGKAPDSVLFQR